MKLRTLPTAVAVLAATLVATNAVTPAYAAPDAPVLVDVSIATTGHVTFEAQTVAEGYLFAGLQADQSDATSLQADNTGSAFFDLETWGYSDVTVHAWACPAAVLDETCSTETSQHVGAPSDVTLPEGDPVWFTDATVGPENGPTTVTITDSAGGGNLVATWSPGGGSPLTTALTRGAATPLNLSNGDGTVTIKRCSSTTPTQCTDLDPVTSKALSVDTDPLGVSVSAIADITTDSPPGTFKVTTDQAGSYSMTYHLESVAAPGVTVLGTTPAAPVAGVLDGSKATSAAQVIAPASVTDGSYKVVGKITVTDATYGPYTNVDFSSAAFTIHRGGPLLDSVTASSSTIYPLVKNVSKYPSAVHWAVVGDVASVTSVKLYKNSNGAFIRTLTLKPTDATHGTVGWSGLYPDATPVPGGLYKVKFYDADSNLSATIGTVTVSTKKLVLKTWKHTYTAAGTLADKYVGKCSTLRKPSRRGWYYSLGYYANTKCASQTSKDSLISTLHAVFLPSAVQYVDIHVTAYGGSAVAKPGSKAILRYLTTSGDWSSEKTMSSKMGYQVGSTRSTTGLVFKDRSFGWGVYTGFGYQYDVKNFTVVLHYKALG